MDSRILDILEDFYADELALVDGNLDKAEAWVDVLLRGMPPAGVTTHEKKFSNHLHFSPRNKGMCLKIR